MNSEKYAATQGAAIAINPTLRDIAGNIIVTYTGSENLVTKVWGGSTETASFTATTTWILPSAGTILIDITAAQTATLEPGNYEVQTRLTDPFYGQVDAFQCVISIVGSDGGIPANLPATIVTPEEAAANVSGFDALASGQNNLLLAVTDEINRRCRRVFPLTTHDEHRYYERGTIRLTHYPVPSVTRLCMGLTAGIRVTNDGTLVRPAMALFPSTTAGDPEAVPATLRLTGYASGVLTTTSLTLASYPMLSDLVAAIGSAGHGWAATIGDATYATRPTLDLNPEWGTRGVPATGTPLRIYAADLTDYELDYETGIVTVHRLPTTDAACGLDLRPGYGGYGNGRPQRPGKLAVRAVYTAGYDPVSMPAALKQAAFILIRVFAQQTVLGVLTQQKINDSFAIASPGFSRAVDDILSDFERRRIF